MVIFSFWKVCVLGFGQQSALCPVSPDPCPPTLLSIPADILSVHHHSLKLQSDALKPLIVLSSCENIISVL